MWNFASMPSRLRHRLAVGQGITVTRQGSLSTPWYSLGVCAFVCGRRTTRTSYGRILEALARVVSYGRWPIEAIVQTEAPHLPYGTTLVVVSAVVNQRLRRTLVDLQRRGYGVALVSLGETEPDALPPAIRHYHVGGREEWHALESLALA